MFLGCVLCTGTSSRSGCGSQVSTEGSLSGDDGESVGTVVQGLKQSRLTTG